MCGIAGFLIQPSRTAPPDALNLMTQAVRHRGPDGEGSFIDADAGIFLGHRRLAILDLSEAGAQPMISQSGRFILILNGEIYNFIELRQQLEAQVAGGWQGTSDTEVLLLAIEAWGIKTTLQRLEGMFAFAVWDKEFRKLTLARDRFGEKPLYMARTSEGLAFASQLKSILEYPGFQGFEDEDAIDLLLTLTYIPEPLTPFTNVWKLPAGCFTQLVAGDDRCTPICYWSAEETAIEARNNAAKNKAGSEDIEREIENRLTTVVSNQMVADVPVGAFLSGGIDSSLVVSLMQKVSSHPVRTYTVGFEEKGYDETPHARAIAKHLGTDHNEVRLGWSEALVLVERLPDIYDEPFADSSQLPTYLVSSIARKSVTVCLSGDGGDEIFGGYNRHVFGMHYEKRFGLIPDMIRAPAGRALAKLTQPRLSGLLSGILSVVGASKKISLPIERLHKLSTALSATSDAAIYTSLVRRDEGFLDEARLSSRIAPIDDALAKAGFCLAERFMLLDTITYLPGDILTKIDRSAMAVSLETRVPYLDHHLFSLAWSQRITDRITPLGSKMVLRKILSRYVPTKFLERPKAGFGVPIDAWLKGPLREWMNARLAAFQLAYPRYAGRIDRAKSEFFDGRGHLQHFLWTVAILQSWHERYATRISNKKEPS